MLPVPMIAHFSMICLHFSYVNHMISLLFKKGIEIIYEMYIIMKNIYYNDASPNPPKNTSPVGESDPQDQNCPR